ncbi:MAG: hypothetical protein NVS9B15_18930 [Acidobacteriaceae bacterium]
MWNGRGAYTRGAAKLLILGVSAVAVGTGSESANAEHRLAGIDLYGDPMSVTLRRMGKPDRVEDIPDEASAIVRGERSYYWYRGALTVRVDTEYHQDEVSHRMVQSRAVVIDVFGDLASSGELARTGAGLSIGNKISRIKHVYGAVSRGADGRAIIRWPDGTTLTVDADKSGRIGHIQLAKASEDDE